jgi:iodotyrosine deiodinase
LQYKIFEKRQKDRMNSNKFKILDTYIEYPENEMISRSAKYYNELNRRRTVRTFSTKEVPRAVIENCIKAAGTAPSGANMQPWHFVVVTSSEIKNKIKTEAEKVEKEFYSGKAPDEWLGALKQLETNSEKPFLAKAPCLIVIFEKKYDEQPNGSRIKHYYTKESVGIATGFLISAIHNAGLVSLTYTPSPMNFLNDILKRPVNEKPFLVLVAGYPEAGTEIPDIERKPIDKIAAFI